MEGINSDLDIAEQKVNALEDIVIESQMKGDRKTDKLANYGTTSHICVNGVPKGRGEGNRRRNMAEDSPKLMKTTHPQIQEAQQSPRQRSMKKAPRHFAA